LSIPPSADAAQPAAAQDDLVARKGASRSQSWFAWPFAWPNLRWAALAASVIVVASVLLITPAKQAPRTDATVSLPSANPSANKDPVQPASESANSVASPPSQYSGSLTGFQAKADRAPRMKSPVVRGNERGNERRDESRDEPIGELRTAAKPVEADKDSTSSTVGAREAQPADKGSFYYSTQKVAPQQLASPGPAARAGLVPSATVGGPTQTVEVAAATPAIETETVQVGSVVGGASSAAAVTKAKEPLKDEAERKAQAQYGLTKSSLASSPETSNSAVSLQKMRSAKQSKTAPAQWSLAEGKLQRSLDAGATWQIALQLQQPLLAFGARGNDVWTGGHSGTLFHSTDGGASWAMIQPSTKAEALSSDIVAIEIRSGAEIILSTNANETWTTTDGGKTWDKK